jgi:hypothetical protein
MIFYLQKYNYKIIISVMAKIDYIEIFFSQTRLNPIFSLCLFTSNFNFHAQTIPRWNAISFRNHPPLSRYIYISATTNEKWLLWWWFNLSIIDGGLTLEVNANSKPKGERVRRKFGWFSIHRFSLENMYHVDDI